MQVLIYIIVALIAFYALCCLALFILQRKILYSPKPPMELPEDVGRIEFRGNPVLLSGRVINSGQEKALLYYGGNAEQIEQHADFFRLLSDYTVYLVPYRGYGGNFGTPTEMDLYRDAEHVYDHISNNHRSISLIGRSLGSGVATYLATTRPLDKLILITPYDSMSNLAQQKYPMFPMRIILKDKYESWKRVDKINAPTLILLAESDTMVPYERSDNLIAHFKHPDVTVVTVPNSQHNDISKFPLYKESIAAHLKQAKA